MVQSKSISELKNHDKVNKDDELTTMLKLLDKLKKAEKSKHYNFDEIKGKLFS